MVSLVLKELCNTFAEVREHVTTCTAINQHVLHATDMSVTDAIPFHYLSTVFIAHTLTDTQDFFAPEGNAHVWCRLYTTFSVPWILSTLIV